jgi:hypothetical protein
MLADAQRCDVIKCNLTSYIGESINYFHDVTRSLVIQPLDGIARFSSPIRVKQAMIQYSVSKTGPTSIQVTIL